MTTSVTAEPAAHTPSAAASSSRIRVLLVCGAAAGPLFLGVAALQATFREGFDLTRHPLSLLSLGELGWIQAANFVVSGLLSVAAAVGLRRVLHPGRGGIWGPLLIGAYGVGLVVAGIFPADPSMGFPAGAPDGMANHLSWHAALHGVGTMLAFPALILATFVLACRFAALGRRIWAVCSVVAGAGALALVAWPDQDGISLRLAAGAALTFGWLAAVAAREVIQLRAKA
jgi:hypothetical protein